MAIKLDKKSLEKISKSKSKSKKSLTDENITPEEEIGFHKGALNTLVAERNELLKIVQNVEIIMQMHLKRLEELGVKINIQGK